jgi:hypothetical protein
VGADEAAGAVNIFTAMFTPDFAATLWTQDDLAPLVSEPDDRFGAELAVGDFDADGRDDLVIGHPGESVGAQPDFGGAALLFGSESGVAADGLQGLPLGTWLVDSLELGYTLSAGRFSGNSGADLAISLPNTSTEVESHAGGVVIFPSVVLFLDDFESADTSAWSTEGT